MALNDQVKFTWAGHGTWKVRTAAGKDMLIDPWVTNPKAPEHLKTVDRLDIMVITHGHGDHVTDAVSIAKATSPKIVTTAEMQRWLAGHGVTENVTGMNKGGTVVVDGVTFTCVHAEHTSSTPDGSGLGGEPVGFVITFENGFRIYFSGDTDVFGDMALIRELEEPEVAFLSIGDFYTMGPRRAVKAVELLGVKTVVPMHYGTFPILTGRPDQLQELVGPSVNVIDIQPGDEI